MGTSYYYRAGKRIPVALSESACAVRLNGERESVAVEGWSPRPLTSRHLLLVRDDLVPAERVPADTPAVLRMIGRNEKARARHERDTSRSGSWTVDTPWNRPDLVTFPVAVTETGEGALIATGEVVAQCPPHVTRGQIERIAALRNWTVPRTLHFLPNGYLLRASASDDPFAFANDLVERHGALYAHPVFLEHIPDRSRVASAPPGERAATLPTPAQYERQWHLANTGQTGGVAGQDIDAENAWRITTGSPDVTVCIIDSGVDTSHECFRGGDKVAPGFDFADLNADPSPADSSHGTSCAALAVAGAGEVLGVAFACRLMPVRRSGLDDHLRLAEAFVFAADHGADVISCSFGVDGEPWVLPDVVRSAFEYVTRRGRHGKGIPIFFAAGNGNEPVSSDEWASSEYTIAVAATTDQAGKAPYSDFGPEVRVCAPSSGGVNSITTAANAGYTSLFGGTSAAAPIAAGVGALLLSVAPNMTWREVRDVLQQAARKIDPARAQYDRAGHSHLYGYGQVDAFRSLQQIDSLLEAERATDTVSLDAQLRQFIGWLQRRPAGAAIASFVVARRLGILVSLHTFPSFRDALERLLRTMASLAPQLGVATDVVIPDHAWPAIELVARAVKDMKPDPSATERFERSTTSNRETPMPTNTGGMEDALNRIAAILNSPTSPGAIAPAGKVPQPPTDTIQPFPHADPSELMDPHWRRREEIAKQVYYSMQVPPITTEALFDMEAKLPHVVDHLRSLAGRPAARAELLATIAATKQRSQGSERSDEEQDRLIALARMISQDAFGQVDERNPVAVAGLVLAAVMAGYTIRNNWAR